MKLLCIKDSNNYAHTRSGVIIVPEHMKVKFGEIYTVSAEVTGYRGVKKWQLHEKPSNCRYEKEYFSPISQAEYLENDLIHLEIINHEKI